MMTGAGVQDVDDLTNAQRGEIRRELDRIVRAFYGEAAMVTVG